MRDLIILFVHVLATSIRLARPGGVRSVLAESVLLKHQLLILNRSRRRAPNLRAFYRADRWIVRSTYAAKTAGSVGSRGEGASVINCCCHATRGIAVSSTMTKTVDCPNLTFLRTTKEVSLAGRSPLCQPSRRQSSLDRRRPHLASELQRHVRPTKLLQPSYQQSMAEAPPSLRYREAC
jgi:hypothetical protein